MTHSFDDLWKFVKSRSAVMTVQEYSELKHVFDLMKDCDCKSYLEVGSAEGNSLYVLGHAVEKHIDIVDFGERHTRKSRQEMIDRLLDDGKIVTEYLGDSRNAETLPNKKKYDCVLIDAGHGYNDVLSDCKMYAGLATKYIFFHDIMLEPVRDAVKDYLWKDNIGEYSTFIASETFGYGIVKVNT